MAPCWKAAICFTISVLLAFVAIPTARHSVSNQAAMPPTRPVSLQLALNASRALRRSGFNIIANLILISPDIFFSSPNSTIFAIKDSGFANATSLPPRHLKHLLQYHTSPSRLAMAALLKKPQGSCVPSLVSGKNIALTKVDVEGRMLEINRVPISHPDMFLEEKIAVHGVLEPFSSLRSRDLYQNWDVVQGPICNANASSVSEASDPKKMVEWIGMIQLLSSHGHVSFAIGLNSVLDRILEDCRNLSSVTIFIPAEFAFLAAPSPILDKVVRLHILPQRVPYMVLASLPDKTLLSTLLPNQDLEITRHGNVTQGVSIGGQEIVSPEIFSSKSFIIHEISEAFNMAELPSTSR